MLNIEHEVLFLPSVSEDIKCFLMRHAVGLLYTPVNEHFGITPLESMALARPVIACNTGGPCETIVHGKTGYLVNGTPQVCFQCMQCWSLMSCTGFRTKYVYSMEQSRESFDIGHGRQKTSEHTLFDWTFQNRTQQNRMYHGLSYLNTSWRSPPNWCHHHVSY